MLATVSVVFDDRDYVFAESDFPLPDVSFARSTDSAETREVFVHRTAFVCPDDWRSLKKGSRIQIKKVTVANGRGLRAEGVSVSEV